MKFCYGVLAVVIALPCWGALSLEALSSYRKYEDVIVGRSSGTAWKILSPSSEKILKSRADWKTQSQATADWTGGEWIKLNGKKDLAVKEEGCRGLLGDGWHIPSEKDWLSDFDDLSKTSISKAMGGEKFWISEVDMSGDTLTHYRAGNFANRTVVRLDGVKNSALPTVCVCGDKVSAMDQRRSKVHCAGFNENRRQTPEELSIIRDGDGLLSKGKLSRAVDLCNRKSMRVPTYPEIVSLKEKLSAEYKNQGCVWSASPREYTDGERILIHTFEEMDGVLGTGKVKPTHDKCYIACVI